MMAIYPGGGARFARHIDNTAGDGRRLTVLCYLNPTWAPAQGGALRMWPPDGSNPVDVFPYCGRLALFYSKTVPHGVQRTASIRHSVTLWYARATGACSKLIPQRWQWSGKITSRTCRGAMRGACGCELGAAALPVAWVMHVGMSGATAGSSPKMSAGTTTRLSAPRVLPPPRWARRGCSAHRVRTKQPHETLFRPL